MFSVVLYYVFCFSTFNFASDDDDKTSFNITHYCPCVDECIEVVHEEFFRRLIEVGIGIHIVGSAFIHWCAFNFALYVRSVEENEDYVMTSGTRHRIMSLIICMPFFSWFIYFISVISGNLFVGHFEGSGVDYRECSMMVSGSHIQIIGISVFIGFLFGGFVCGIVIGGICIGIRKVFICWYRI